MRVTRMLHSKNLASRLSVHHQLGIEEKPETQGHTHRVVRSMNASRTRPASPRLSLPSHGKLCGPAQGGHGVAIASYRHHPVSLLCVSLCLSLCPSLICYLSLVCLPPWAPPRAVLCSRPTADHRLLKSPAAEDPVQRRRRLSASPLSALSLPPLVLLIFPPSRPKKECLQRGRRRSNPVRRRSQEAGGAHHEAAEDGGG